MLRSTLILIPLFMMVALALDAQSCLGLRIGGLISEVKPYGYVDIGNNFLDRSRSPMTAYQLGVTANHQVGKRVSLDTDVIYSRKGFFSPTYQLSSISLNYLSFPLTLNAQFQDGPVDFLMGLEPGFLMSAHYKEGESTTEVTDQWTALDVGANLGIAYRFNPAFRIKFSYYLGIPSIYRSPLPENKVGQLGNPNQRMRAFHCSVNYYVVSKNE